MASETNFRKLFIDELRDAYHAEKQLTKALPKLAKASTAPDLREAFETHLEETQGHVERLERVFELLGEPVKAKPCAGMLGIIEEGSDLIKEEDKGPALDAGLIAGAQRAEHYEMAAYGSLMAWAKALGEDKVVEHLEATLEEEKAADEKLSDLAEGGINAAAADGDEEDESDDDESDSAAKTAGRGATSSKSSGMRAAPAKSRR